MLFETPRSRFLERVCVGPLCAIGVVATKDGLPTVAAMRAGVRAGVATATGLWITLTALAGAVPIPVSGEIPQDVFVLATIYATALAGAVGALPLRFRWLGALVPLAWLGFFAMRDPWLVKAPAVAAVPVLAAAWAALFYGMERSPRLEVLS